MKNTYTRLPVKIPEDIVRIYYHSIFDTNNSGVIVDDACYELMFVKENNVKIIDGNNAAFKLFPFFTLNNMKGPFKFDYPNNMTTFCVKLQPWMNASFVSTKKSEVLNLAKVYDKSVAKLHEKIFSSESIDEMVQYVEPFIMSLNIVPNKDVELVKSICDLILKKSGDITVAEIAERFNVYRQKLNSIFKQEVKYTLKTFINNIRIRACLAYKLKQPEISLTEIAHQFGFYDQAHFVHSFKNATGVSPSEYVNKPGYSEFPWERKHDGHFRR